MCSPVKCKTCGKTTWSGCGQHIDQVKRNVPKGQWCDGNHPKSEKTKSGFFSFGRR